MLKSAKYGVIIWSPPRLPFPDADLTVGAICDLVKDLNTVTRCSGFALGGNDAVPTASAVCAWQSGYPFRVSFARGYPEYDPIANAASTRLAAGDVDALIWVTSFSPNALPPATTTPTVLLAPPLSKVPASCAVYIPVATPGVDHGGQMCRVDNVVSLPLRKVRDSALPSVAMIGQRLLQLV
jgi:formylmethanofuran dehydrogenase subunit B